MRIGFASDYSGFEWKERLRARFSDQGHSTKDFSTGDPGLANHQVEMSPSHFSKLFKLSTGLAPLQFVTQERINRSKELVRQDDARIVDVALGVGFENQAHFTIVFGNLVGMTPRQFQRSADAPQVKRAF